MSHEREHSDFISEQTLALFLEDNGIEALTDILVQSLEETLSILRDEYVFDTVH
ncbi:hypothetical protein [Pseudorhizobium tarimense]|uniref:hypothetical protein n=1 Tax=Pseudorhizobium tarimense TaxID=1079109 RepID=UPI00339B8A5A